MTNSSLSYVDTLTVHHRHWSRPSCMESIARGSAPFRVRSVSIACTPKHSDVKLVGQPAKGYLFSSRSVVGRMAVWKN